MLRKDRYQAILHYFETQFPVAETELDYGNPYELLVAVILSAQCTDKRVNMTTPALFQRFPDPASLAASTPEEVLTYIKSISYPNNKAKHLVNMAQRLMSAYNGEVPDSVAELTTLAGVGRKTANVVVSVVYNQPAMAVDTHVFRVSKRLGLVNQNLTTPRQVEDSLMRYLPKAKVHVAHHWLILHGRYVCMARKPACEKCGISQWCRFYERQQSKLAKGEVVTDEAAD